ncbi:MAG: hypothetical protein NXH96_19780 [Alteromonadaceae bacterium]|nr:hypothetical protein [Alteromonadaceae bacterium]
MVALYAGLDVSQELTSICVVDEEGRMVREAILLRSWSLRQTQCGSVRV